MAVESFSSHLIAIKFLAWLHNLLSYNEHLTTEMPYLQPHQMLLNLNILLYLKLRVTLTTFMELFLG